MPLPCPSAYMLCNKIITVIARDVHNYSQPLDIFFEIGLFVWISSSKRLIKWLRGRTLSTHASLGEGGLQNACRLVQGGKGGAVRTQLSCKDHVKKSPKNCVILIIYSIQQWPVKWRGVILIHRAPILFKTEALAKMCCYSSVLNNRHLLIIIRGEIKSMYGPQ